MESKMNNRPLNSGISYTISELFSGNRKIVIPDMQREYCWPSVSSVGQNCSLVTSYVRDLIRSFKDNFDSRMGLIYAYELPANHIQLCDGQQRTTTIYLLIGCLTKIISKVDEKQYQQAEDVLISEFEQHDDHEPRLQYAIRESTLLFLRDLVSNYFLGEDTDIKNADWYFSSYNEDPSIQNILKAIDEINSMVNENIASGLLSYILSKISFLYFDMQSRRYGEEQFVVLNTTGKPLTPSEHLKPQLIGAMKNVDNAIKKQYSDMWESWEQFFWDNRPKDDAHSNFVVDDYLNEFLRWMFICENVEKETELFRDDAKQYSGIQKVLAGSRIDIVEYYKGKDVTKLFDTIDKYKDALLFIIKNNITIDSDCSSDRIFPKYSLWDIMLKDEDAKHVIYRLTTRHCATLLPVLSYVKAKIENRETPVVDNVIRLSRICWEIAQKNASNYDVVRLCVFIKNNGDKVLESLLNQNDNLYTESIKKSAIVRLSEGMEMNILSDYENEYWKLIHLNTVKGESGFIFNVLGDNINAISIRKIAENLRLTYERPTNQLRRALLTYTDYYQGAGWSKIGGRYCYAKDSGYFFYMFHEKNANIQVKTELLNFLRDIQNEADVNSFIERKLSPGNEPVLDKGSEEWKKLVARLYKDPHRFDYGRGRGYVAWNDSRQCGYMLTSYKVTDGSFAKIIPTSHREEIGKLCKRLNENTNSNWEIIEQWKLRRQIEKNIEGRKHLLYLEADFLSSDESLGELCYSISTRDMETWEIFNSRLLGKYPHADKDLSNPNRPYIHIGKIQGTDTDLILQTLTDILKFLHSL